MIGCLMKLVSLVSRTKTPNEGAAKRVTRKAEDEILLSQGDGAEKKDSKKTDESPFETRTLRSKVKENPTLQQQNDISNMVKNETKDDETPLLSCLPGKATKNTSSKRKRAQTKAKDNCEIDPSEKILKRKRIG
jgi:hypothetical protein